MMNENNVAAIAEEIYGDKINPHTVSAACTWVEERLKKDITEEEKRKYLSDIEYAAAVKAAAEAAVIDAVGLPGEIKVGDVSVKNIISRESADRLIEGALETIKFLMAEEGFAFSAVSM